MELDIFVLQWNIPAYSFYWLTILKKTFRRHEKKLLGFLVSHTWYNFAVSMSQKSQTQQSQWHRGVWLSGLKDKHLQNCFANNSWGPNEIEPRKEKVFSENSNRITNKKYQICCWWPVKFLLPKRISWIQAMNRM